MLGPLQVRLQLHDSYAWLADRQAGVAAQLTAAAQGLGAGVAALLAEMAAPGALDDPEADIEARRGTRGGGEGRGGLVHDCLWT